MKPIYHLNKNITLIIVAFFMLLLSNTANANCNFHANFTFTASSTNCKTINFTNTSYVTNASDSGVSYLWKNGSNIFATIKNASLTFSTNGTYNICLIMFKQTSGGMCSDTICKTITINCGTCTIGNLAWNWNYNCSNRTVSFNGSNSDSTGTYKYTWSFGDQSYDTLNHKSTSHVYPNNGSYTVCWNVKKYDNGTVCKDTTLCKTIVVGGMKVSEFTSTSSGANCKVVTFNIQDSNTCAIYYWNWGDNTTSMQTSKYPMTHTYTGTGPYTVCLKTRSCADSNCYVTKCKTITLNCNTCPTVVTWGFNVTCPSRSVSFTSVIGDTTGSFYYLWEFGDSSSSANTKNATHTYSKNGTYTVCLRVKRYSSNTTAPCFDTTICKTVTINCTNSNCSTYANWTWSVVCPSRLVSFSSGVADSTGSFSYSWNYGDNSSLGNLKNTTHTYAANGTYNVCLRIKRFVGGSNIPCFDTTICKTVTINCSTPPCPLTANWTYSVHCPSRVVTFTSSVGDSTGSYMYMWNFGANANAVYTKNATYTFSANGSYTVCLTIKRLTAGTTTVCRDTTICKTFIINCSGCQLTPNFTPTVNCALKKVEVTNSSTGDSCLTYKWAWGDGTYSNVKNPGAHAYAQAGTYTVCLTIRKCTDTTCAAYVCKTVVIPVNCCNTHAYFGASINCAQKKVEVMNYSYGDSCMNYKWSWGDGTYSYVKSPLKHIYTSPGTYTVCLKATKCNDTTCFNTFCKTIVIPATCCPTPSFYFYNFCNTFRFINTTVGGTSYWWSFGDSSFSSAKSPYHTFFSKRTFTVCLTVFDSVRNCTTTVCKQVTVNCRWFGNHHFEVPLNDDNIGDAEAKSIEGDNINTDLTPAGGLQVNSQAGITAYPNPTNSYLNIVLPATNATIKITDITGAVLMQYENVSSFYKADVSHLAAGVYFVNVINEKGTQSVRFMKN